MKQKLWMLNLLLLIAIGLLGRGLYQSWQSAREREKKVLDKTVATAKPVPSAQTPPPPAVQALGYNDVAQQTLFSKDRNPNVIEEPPPPPAPPPPFPRMFGVMNLGDGLEAVLSDGPGRQKPFRVGDKIGEFKLAEIGQDFLVFEWKDKKLTKKFSELIDKGDSGGGGQDVAARTPTTTPPPPAAPPPPARAAPGVDTGGGVSACVAGDNSPAGTIADGKKKVITETPFGKVCRWEVAK